MIFLEARHMVANKTVAQFEQSKQNHKENKRKSSEPRTSWRDLKIIYGWQVSTWNKLDIQRRLNFQPQEECTPRSGCQLGRMGSYTWDRDSWVKHLKILGLQIAHEKFQPLKTALNMLLGPGRDRRPKPGAPTDHVAITICLSWFCKTY